MPEIDGLSLIQMLRAQRPLMPYIFLSGRGAPDATQTVQNADAFVLKIDGPQNLIRRILDVLAVKGRDAGTSQSGCAV
jgi:CheY-like chemotaxis protein